MGVMLPQAEEHRGGPAAAGSCKGEGRIPPQEPAEGTQPCDRHLDGRLLASRTAKEWLSGVSSQPSLGYFVSVAPGKVIQLARLAPSSAGFRPGIWASVCLLPHPLPVGSGLIEIAVC